MAFPSTLQFGRIRANATKTISGQHRWPANSEGALPIGFQSGAIGNAMPIARPRHQPIHPGPDRDLCAFRVGPGTFGARVGLGDYDG